MDSRRVVDDTLALCAVAAPTGFETARAAAVVRLLEAAGIEYQVDATGNVTARFGGEGPPVIFAAHLDTVFPESTPINPRREGNRLYGPGIGDNTVAIASAVELARNLRVNPPANPIVIAFTVGEEGNGDLRGMRALLGAVPARWVIALEGHGVDSIVTRGVGSARFRAEFAGPGGHSWQDRGRPSAIHALLGAGQRALRAAVPVSANIGVIAGGTSINTIAAAATLEIDLRSVDETALDLAAARVVTELKRPSDGVEVTVTPIGRRPAGAVDPGHPLVRAAKAARRAAHLPPAREETASTDANAAYARGIPAITIGMTTGSGIHRLDEWIDVEPLDRSLAALLHLAANLPGTR